MMVFNLMNLTTKCLLENCPRHMCPVTACMYDIFLILSQVVDYIIFKWNLSAKQYVCKRNIH